MKFGLIGPHRSGKTTLAEAVSNETDLPLVLTSVASVFKRLGVDPAKQMPLDVRIDVQKAVLDEQCEAWSKERAFITDRTPIDMIGYTMADIGIGNAPPAKYEKMLLDYIDRCYEAHNAHFHGALFVPSALPVVEDASKSTGLISRAYIDHLSMVMMGAAQDPRSLVRIMLLNKSCTALKDRVAAVCGTIDELSHRFSQLTKNVTVN